MPCHKISKLETRKEASKWHNYLNYEGRAQDDVDDDACSSSGERNKMQIDLVPAQLLGSQPIDGIIQPVWPDAAQLICIIIGHPVGKGGV